MNRTLGKSSKPLHDGYTKNVFSDLLTIRLIPLFRFFVDNPVSGLIRVNIGTYLGTAALGVVAGYADTGYQLGDMHALTDEHRLVECNRACVILGLLALVPVV